MITRPKHIEPWLALKEYKTLIILSASINNVDASLLGAILLHESSARPYAARFEDGFYKKYIEGKSKQVLRGFWPKWTESFNGEIKEKLDRSTSWGLGQIMGQTAREHGFEGTYLCELCDPEVNIPFTAKYLARKFKQASEMGLIGQDLRRGALLRYNGGGDKDYPIRVLGQIDNARRIFE